MNKINFSNFPKEKHFAIISFDGGCGYDTEGWWCGDNTVNYFVMTGEEIIDWIERQPRHAHYKVIEVYPVEINIPRPTITSTKTV